MSWGSNRIQFFYDDNGTPLGFNYFDGVNASKYYYVTNLQGDIVQIRDVDNAIVAKYSYNSWGKLIKVTNKYDQ